MEKKRKSIIQLGLKEMTKSDLEIKIADKTEITQRIIGAPKYETVKARLVRELLLFSLQEIDIPYVGPKNSLIDAIISRRATTPDKVSETISNLITQMTRLYHMNVMEREQYVRMALDRLTREMQLTDEEVAELRDDIQFILLDGINKNFRDNLGRQIPIPEATVLANLVTNMQAVIERTIGDGKPLINIDETIKLLREYMIIEQRAFLSSSEYDKRQIYDELSALTDRAVSNPIIGMLTKNRLEYSVNAASPTIKMSFAKFSELINEPLINFELFDISTPTKVAYYDMPIIASEPLLDQVDTVSLKGVIKYIDESLGAIITDTTVSDIAGVLLNGEINTFSATENRNDSSFDVAILTSLTSVLFKKELIKLLAQSFTVLPAFQSQSLSRIAQSLSSRLDTYNIEPFIIAIDNIKQAYRQALTDTINLISNGLAVTEMTEIEKAKQRLSNSRVYRYMISTDHDALYISLMNQVISDFEKRLTDNDKGMAFNNQAWRIGRKMIKPAEGVNVVNRGMLYNVECHVEKTVESLVNDGTMTDEEMIAIMTGVYGVFENVPYQTFKYTFSQADLDEIFSFCTLQDYDVFREKCITEGIGDEVVGTPVLLSPSDKEQYEYVRERLNIPNDRFWAVRMPLRIIMIPRMKFSVITINPLQGTSNTYTSESPYFNVHTTVMNVKHSERIVAYFRHKNMMHAKVISAWPGISTRVTPIADLTHNRYLASLINSANRRNQPSSHQIEFTGTPKIELESTPKPIVTNLNDIRDPDNTTLPTESDSRSVHTQDDKFAAPSDSENGVTDSQ